jgi:hypothetical protein
VPSFLVLARVEPLSGSSPGRLSSSYRGLLSPISSARGLRPHPSLNKEVRGKESALGARVDDHCGLPRSAGEEITGILFGDLSCTREGELNHPEALARIPLQIQLHAGGRSQKRGLVPAAGKYGCRKATLSYKARRFAPT